MQGDALPAEMLPEQITFNDVQFRLAPREDGTPNALVAKGQTIDLPAGHYNRVYVLRLRPMVTRRPPSSCLQKNRTEYSGLGRLHRPMG